MSEASDKEQRVQQFLQLNHKPAGGKLKIYPGMSAGIKTTEFYLLTTRHCSNWA